MKIVNKTVKIKVFCINDDFSHQLDKQIIKALKPDLPRLFNNYTIKRQHVINGILHFEFEEIQSIFIKDKPITFNANQFVVINNN